MCLPDGLGTVDGGAHARLDVVVVSLVLVLLLTPHQVGVGVFLRLSLDQVEGERRELRDEGKGSEVTPVTSSTHQTRSSAVLFTTLRHCAQRIPTAALAHLKTL